MALSAMLGNILSLNFPGEGFVVRSALYISFRVSAVAIYTADTDMSMD